MSGCKYAPSRWSSRNYSPDVALNLFVFSRKTGRNYIVPIGSAIGSVHALRTCIQHPHVQICYIMGLSLLAYTYLYISIIFEHTVGYICANYFTCHIFLILFPKLEITYVFLHIFENRYEECAKSHCHFFLLFLVTLFELKFAIIVWQAWMWWP